jgi:hypothetical protein
LSQVLDLDDQVVFRGAARCASQVLDRGAKAASRGAAALSRSRRRTTRQICSGAE